MSIGSRPSRVCRVCVATKNGIDIDTANEEAIKRIKAARPTLVGIGDCADVIRMQ